MLDLIVRRASILDGAALRRCDIGIAAGRIAAIEPALPGGGPEIDAEQCLVVPGLIETHLHLDKTCILDRCRAEEGTLAEAVRETAAAKRSFTAEDVYARGRRTLECCIAHGTMHVRTHVELDPGIGMTGFEGVRRLARDYAWAVDMQLCAFPQEGLLNNPGTEALLREALRHGAKVLGAVPYTDSDPRGQIDRIFEIAREFDVDIDMHLDLAETTDGMQIEYVCRKTEEHGWGGRVAVGHATQLSLVPRARFDAIAAQLARAGVAVTILPATDLYLMGRSHDHAARRDAGRAAAPRRGDMLARDQQRAEPVHALWRRVADADRQPLRQCLPRGAAGGAGGMPRHDHGIGGAAAAAPWLRHRRGCCGQPGGHRRGRPGRRHRYGRVAALGLEGWPALLHADPGDPAPAVAIHVFASAKTRRPLLCSVCSLPLWTGIKVWIRTLYFG